MFVLPSVFNLQVIQKRQLGGAVNFNRNWKDYKNGFGNESTEFWLGKKS